MSGDRVGGREASSSDSSAFLNSERILLKIKSHKPFGPARKPSKVSGLMRDRDSLSLAIDAKVSVPIQAAG